MLPNIKRQQRLQPLGDRIVCAGLLCDDEGAVGGGGEPDPAGAEEGDAFGDEVGFEGVDTSPLRLDLGLQMPGRSRA